MRRITRTQNSWQLKIYCHGFRVDTYYVEENFLWTS
ncbi:hypothetical protein CLPUN_28920 [Clostridium puniceum]|uniref:Uncharacterized protein n=1 Tax=Clostridium puniceum TaxID=29367 RepID=A0A1S8TEK0_9CLOT|nr:hypothetical protein CLPUN_28920 [Clostridium puniceum]